MKKTIIIILSDPNAGEEALGRAFNAMILALQLKQKGADFEIIFQGTGARWPIEFSKEDHRAHGLYLEIEDHISVCGGCADVFGATEELEKNKSLKFIREAKIEGTGGMTDTAKYVLNGDNVLIF